MSEEVSKKHRPLVERVAAEKVVIAENIENFYYSSPSPHYTPLGPFDSVPELPPNFIPRPEFLEPLVERLLTDTSSVAITALKGSGGVGKTVTALSLCHDARVRAAFPDGIVWLSIGRQSTVSTSQHIEQIATALNRQFREYSEASYRSLLRDRAVLLVLDNVWTFGAVEPFQPPSGRSRLLYTSRDGDLAGQLGTDNFEIGLLNGLQARRFLLRWSGRDSELPPPESQFTGILEECGGLVLALAMIGARLRGHDNEEWAHVLEDLRKARLKMIGRRPRGYEYETLHASIAVSVDALGSETGKAYARLAALLEDMPAPEAMLRALWGGNPEHVHRIANQLVAQSLASRDADGSLRLHDLQWDYLCAEYRDAAALALIHATVLRSLHIVRTSPDQFYSQIIGRLLPYAQEAGVAAFIAELDADPPRPTLRPLMQALEPAGTAEMRVLEGHSEHIRSIAVSQDGTRLLSAAINGEPLRLWKLDSQLTHVQMRSLGMGTGHLAGVAISADGRRGVSVSFPHPNGGSLSVWDLGNDAPPVELVGRSNWLTSVAISADGRLAIAGSHDKWLEIWDLDRRSLLNVFEGHTGHVWSVTISRDGTIAVSGSDDNTVRVWDLSGSKPPRTFEGHSDIVFAVDLSFDRTTVASGSRDGTVRVWDLTKDQPPRILRGHTGYVRAVAFSSDGSHLVSGSLDCTLRVWNLTGFDSTRVLEGHRSGVTSVVFLPGDKRIISGSDDKTLRIWDLDRPQRTSALPLYCPVGSTAAFCLKYLPISKEKEDIMLALEILDDKAKLETLEGHAGELCHALSASANRMIAGFEDGTVRAWDARTEKMIQMKERHESRVSAVACSSDGSVGISGSWDKTARIWDITGGRLLRILEHGQTCGSVTCVALSLDGRLALTGAWDGSVRIWDTINVLPPLLLLKYNKPISAIALSEDNEFAISASYDETLCLLNVNDRLQPPKLLHGLASENSLIPTMAWATLDWTKRHIAISHDGRRAMTGSNMKMQIWNVEDGTNSTTFSCDDTIRSCAWTRTDAHVIVSDSMDRIHVLSLKE